MKKILALILTTAMVISLTACSISQGQPAASSEAPSVSVQSSAGEAASPSAASSETGSAQAPSSDAKPLAGKRVAIAHISLNDEWCILVQKEFDKQLKELGAVEVNHQDANIDQEIQIRQIENFITQKYDVIFCDPAGEGISGVLKKVGEAGIPLVVFDAPVEAPQAITHVAWDQAETGKLCGQWVTEYANKNLGGKAKVAMLAMYLSHSLLRVNAFKEEVKKTPGIEIVYEQDFEGNREKASNIVANLPEKVDVIFATEDNGAWGAISALQSRGITDTKVISAGGFGEEPFSCLRKKDPAYFVGTVAVPPRNIAKDSINAYLEYLKGNKDIQKEINIQIELVTQDNIMQLYPEPIK